MLTQLKRNIIRKLAIYRIKSILETESIDCPLCGSAQHSVLHAKDRYGLPVSVVLCSCGFVFENPIPTGAFQEKFYGSPLFRALDWGILYPNRFVRREFKTEVRANKHIVLLERLLKDKVVPEICAMLDVGASEGTFVRLLHAKMPNIEIGAVEPGNFGKSISVNNVWKSIDDIPSDKRFDLITLWHVLEHIREPENFLETLCAHLSPQGSIIIEVPDVSKYDNSIRPIHIDHLWHFSEETLSRLAAKAGLVVRDISRKQEELQDEVYGMVLTFTRL